MINRLRENEEGYVTAWVLILAVAVLSAAAILWDGTDRAREGQRATMVAHEAGRAAAQELSAGVVAGDNVTLDVGGAADAARRYLSDAGVQGSVTVQGTEVLITTRIPWEPTMAPLPSDTLTGSATIDAREVTAP